MFLNLVTLSLSVGLFFGGSNQCFGAGELSFQAEEIAFAPVLPIGDCFFTPKVGRDILTTPETYFRDQIEDYHQLEDELYATYANYNGLKNHLSKIHKAAVRASSAAEAIKTELDEKIGADRLREIFSVLYRVEAGKASPRDLKDEHRESLPTYSRWLVLKREEEEIKALELEAEKEMLRSLLTASSISKRLKSLRDVDQTGILHPPKEIDPGTDANLQFPESILERLEAIEKDGTTLRRRAAQDSKLLRTAEGIMAKTAPTLRTIPELEP